MKTERIQGAWRMLGPGLINKSPTGKDSVAYRTNTQPK